MTLGWTELLSMKERFGEALQKKTYKEKEQEVERGKKRYQERLAEEREALREIKTYKREEKEALDNDERPTFP